MKLIRSNNFSQDLSAAALSASVSARDRDKLITQVLVHASTAISETITLTINSKYGANYDTLLVSATLSSETDYVFRPDGELWIQAGDAFDIAITNTGGTGTVYVVCQFKAE